MADPPLDSLPEKRSFLERGLLARVLDISSEGMLTLKDGQISYANPSAVQMLGGQAVEELLGLSFSVFFAPSIREEIESWLHKAFEEPELVQRRTDTLERKDDARMPVKLTAFCHESDGTRSLHLLCKDLSALAEEQSFSQAIIDSLPGVFYQLDDKNRLVRWNNGRQKIMGHLPAVLANSSIFERFPSHQHESLSRAMESVAVEGHGSVEMDLLFADGGGSAPFLFSGSRFVSNAGGDGMIGIGVDLRSRRATAARMQDLAYLDSVTGMYNRTYLSEKAGELATEEIPFLLLGIGIDGFLFFNDNYGLHFGDAVLVTVAEALQAEIELWRGRATLIRYRDDEFMLLVEDVADAQITESVAQVIRERFALPFRVEGRDLQLSASIGAAAFPAHAGNVNEVLRCVNIAMHAVKRDGGAGFRLFKPELAARLSRHARIEAELRNAVRTNIGLRLVYQPIVDLKTGLIDSAEALLRWENSSLGNLPPDKFVPVAEQSELAVELGSWVLKEAVRQIAEWDLEGHPEFTVSINVSARQFERHEFSKEVREVLAQHGVPPTRLKIELTETVLANNRERIRAELVRLRSLGVQSLIDDYGTGYSNLSYLRDFPADILKVDRSFISGLDGSGVCDLIVKNLVAVTHGLRGKVVAEGAETMEQVEILREYGCDFVQGWAVGRPAETEAFKVLLKANPELLPVKPMLW